MYEANQRVKVDLSGLTIGGVHFSQNVREALGTVVREVSAEPVVYEVELLFSFKGVRRVEVPVELRLAKKRKRRIRGPPLSREQGLLSLPLR